jgi:hypothetical protein
MDNFTLRETEIFEKYSIFHQFLPTYEHLFGKNYPLFGRNFGNFLQGSPGFLYCFLLYLTWLIPYGFKMFYLSWHLIVSKQVEGSLTYSLDNFKKRVLKFLPKFFGKLDDRILFVFIHFSQFLLTWPFCKFPLRLQFFVMFFAFLISLFNGASYYIDYFSMAFEKNKDSYRNETPVTMKTTLKTSGEDPKTTLKPCGEDPKSTLKTSGEDLKTSLETSSGKYLRSSEKVD